jgi:Lrp/AsnC family leucine-responsive transcriptional regulator
MEKLDATDVLILHLLQTDGRVKRKDIAEAIGLSLPSASERMRKLEERGVITGYHATLDAKRLGVDVTAFVRVSVDGSEHYPAFIAAVTAMDEVQELHSITGEGSHLLKVRVRNTSALEKLLARIQALPGARGTQTSIVLSALKETRYLPVEPMTLYHPEPNGVEP